MGLGRVCVCGGGGVREMNGCRAEMERGFGRRWKTTQEEAEGEKKLKQRDVGEKNERK